jgi:tetratricopeptide (TPR) repeat protein
VHRLLRVTLVLAACLPVVASSRLAYGQREISPQISIQVGANFYQRETWEPGRVRQWMRNDGEIFLVNETAGAQAINLRFTAEAFHISRDLQISVDGRRVAQWGIEARAERHIVVRALALDPGRHHVIFHTVQPPQSPAGVGQGGDQRALSVAFGPFSVIDAGAPEARTDLTSPFATGPDDSKHFTPAENAAHYLRRQGRLIEAARGYEQVMGDGATDYTYLLYGMTLLSLDRPADAKRVFQQCTTLKSSGVRAAWVRDFCVKAVTYVGESPIFTNAQLDPGRQARAEGRIGDAMETYRRILAREPNAVQAHYWLAMIYGLAERRTDALPHVDRVIAIAGDSLDGQFLKAIRTYL